MPRLLSNNIFRYIPAIVIIFILIQCTGKSHQSLQRSQAPVWIKDLNLYEVCLPIYSQGSGIDSLLESVNRLKGLCIKSILLHPTIWIDSITNQDFKRNRFSIYDHVKSFHSSDDAKKFTLLIEKAHQAGIKVLIKWNIRTLSKNHEFVQANASLLQQENQTESFDSHCAVLDLKKEKSVAFMSRQLNEFILAYPIDGFVFTDTEFADEKFWAECRKNIKNWEKLFLINRQMKPTNSSSSVFHLEYHENLFQIIMKYNKSEDPNHLIKYVDTLISTKNNDWVNYSYSLEEHFYAGPETYTLGGKHKMLEALIHFIPGVPLIYNGQEEPQYSKLDPQNHISMSIGNNYLKDFHRTLFLQKQNNPAFWLNQNTTSFRKVSEDQNILALEKKSGNNVAVGFFNLSDQNMPFTILSDYPYYFNLSNKAKVIFKRNEKYQLGPYQHIIITNTL